jgi:hypothetical protein
MKTIRTINVTVNPPSTNSLWINKGKMRYFNNGVWQSIGEGSEYILPAATLSEIGGVKKASYISNLEAAAELSAVITKINSLLVSLKNAGIMDVDAN